MQTLHAPWETLTDLKIGGVPMAKRLTIVGAMFDPDGEDSPVADQFTFHEVALKAPLNEIYDSIREYDRDFALRKRLPVW